MQPISLLWAYERAGGFLECCQVPGRSRERGVVETGPAYTDHQLARASKPGLEGWRCGQYSQRHGDVEEAPVGQAHVKCCCQGCGDRDTQPGQPVGKHEAETPEGLLAFPFHHATQGEPLVRESMLLGAGAHPDWLGLLLSSAKQFKQFHTRGLTAQGAPGPPLAQPANPLSSYSPVQESSQLPF